MAGSGTEHLSSQRCVHIGQNNPASRTLINGDRRFLPQWQIGQRMKQATLCYHLVPWLRTPAILPSILLPLTQPATSISLWHLRHEDESHSTVWLSKPEVWKDYIPVVLHKNLQTNLTAFLPQSRGWSCYVNTNTDTFPAPTAQSHWPKAQSPVLRHQPRLANVTCVWSWRVCETTPAITLGKWPTWCIITLYKTFIIIILYMFRATLCSSSGGRIVLIQHLV